MVIIAAAFIWMVCKEPNATLFSSNTSPDGLLVAENYLVDGCLGECATGRIAIRNLHTGKSREFTFSPPMPGIFFRWYSADRLVIFQEGSLTARPISMSNQLSGIQTTYATYPALTATAAAAQAKQIEKRTIHALDVSATFVRGSVFETMQDWQTCDLTIFAKDRPESQEIGIAIIARTRLCGSEHPEGKTCGYMDSRYWLSRKQDQISEKILTSADISGANGYAILPTGRDHKAIRGQFLGRSASSVVRLLKNSSLSVIYNFDFVQSSRDYEIPTGSILQEIAKFQACIKDVDFEWLDDIH